MEIAKLGEFGLIDHLTKDIEIKNESTKYGVGATAPYSPTLTKKYSSPPTC